VIALTLADGRVISVFRGQALFGFLALAFLMWNLIIVELRWRDLGVIVSAKTMKNNLLNNSEL